MSEERFSMDELDTQWDGLPSQARLSSVTWGTSLLKPGSQVVLRPRANADLFDVFLANKVATIQSIEHDFEGDVQLAVTIDDDPGRDLGQQMQSGHRFFFRLDEVEPLAPQKVVPHD